MKDDHVFFGFHVKVFTTIWNKRSVKLPRTVQYLKELNKEQAVISTELNVQYIQRVKEKL